MLFERREFLRGVPALLASSALTEAASTADAETETRTRFYVMQQFLLEQGPQTARLHEFLSKTMVPALARIHKGPFLVMDAQIAPHSPTVTAILGLETLDQVLSVSKDLFADKDFAKGYDQWESGDEPFISSSATLLSATDYSPEITMPDPPPAAPRIIEMRVYHSPTMRQRKALDERFANSEIKIFHRSGVHPLFYSSTVFGENRPNLTYLIPFDSLAAREKAWAAFGADPDWDHVRKESVDRYGQITAVLNISLHRATAYSPVR